MSDAERDQINRLVGACVKRARRRRHISQEAFAALIGLSRPSLANIEAGRQAISVAQLALIARATYGDIWDDHALRDALGFEPLPAMRANEV